MTRYVYICLGTNLYVYIGICAQFVHPYRKATEERKRKQKHTPEERRTGGKRIILFCSILVDAKAKKKQEEENKKQDQNHSGKQHYNNKEWEWEWREREREIKRNVDSTQQVIFRISFSRAIYIISANIAEDAMIVFSVPVCVRTCICVCAFAFFQFHSHRCCCHTASKLYQTFDFLSSGRAPIVWMNDKIMKHSGVSNMAPIRMEMKWLSHWTDKQPKMSINSEMKSFCYDESWLWLCILLAFKIQRIEIFGGNFIIAHRNVLLMQVRYTLSQTCTQTCFRTQCEALQSAPFHEKKTVKCNSFLKIANTRKCEIRIDNGHVYAMTVHIVRYEMNT